MNIPIKKYAWALYESLKEAKADDHGKIFENFFTMVRRRGIAKFLERIMKECEAYGLAKKGIIEVRVETVFPLTADEKASIAKKLQTVVGGKVVLNELKNTSLLGGAVFSFEDKILDMSLKYQLNNLQKQ